MNQPDKTVLLNELAQEIKVCRKCRLCELATNAVPGVGDPNAELVFIGEAPGFHEDQQGEPFVGRAGKLLDFLLHQVKLTRQQVWIGNIIKHRPPDNRDPLEDEILACQPYLTRQLEILQPKLIVTLGRFAMNYFLPNAKISQTHGEINRTIRYNVFPVYHPAAALRSPTMKNVLILDFLKIPAILSHVNNSNSNTDPTPSDISTAQNTNLSDNNGTEQIGLF